MKRIFESETSSDGYFVRKIITDNEIITQLVINETIEESEKRYGMKVCVDFINRCNGNSKGYIFREDYITLHDTGWNSAEEFIRERMKCSNYYKEVS